MNRMPRLSSRLAALGALALCCTVPAHAQYKQVLGNDMSKCRGGNGPAVLVTVAGIKSAEGRIRVQSYRATAADWLQKGRWLTRTEAPARAGSMTFCVPVPAAGSYAIAVRHDLNGDGKTNLFGDGGGMSNDPPVNVFNLGRPSHTRTAFAVGNGTTAIRLTMRYR